LKKFAYVLSISAVSYVEIDCEFDSDFSTHSSKNLTVKLLLFTSFKTLSVIKSSRQSLNLESGFVYSFSSCKGLVEAFYSAKRADSNVSGLKSKSNSTMVLIIVETKPSKLD